MKKFKVVLKQIETYEVFVEGKDKVRAVSKALSEFETLESHLIDLELDHYSSEEIK